MQISDISLFTNELNRKDWDGLLLPLEVGKFLDEDSVHDFSRIFGQPVPPVSFSRLGESQVREFFVPDGSSGEAHRKYLLFVGVESEHQIEGNGLRSIVRILNKFLLAHQDITSFCVPLLSQDPNPQAAFERYQLMRKMLVQYIKPDIEIKIYIPDQERFRRLNKLVMDQYLDENTGYNLKKKIASSDFYLVKSHMADGSTGFIDQGLWFPRDSQAFQGLLPEIEVGNFLCLRVNLSDKDMIKIVAIGEVTGIEEVALHVNWFLRDFNLVSVSTHTDAAIIPLTHERLKGEIIKLIEQSRYEPIGNKSSAETMEKEQESSALSLLNNDSDSGVDYLDISSDVDAFAKIIALKKFTPPLAIALCAKWGSGKSFFMNKLIERIDYLSNKNPDELFCTGVVHIRFNAWSYMDSNLWASMVGKIFASLNQYINQDRASDEVKLKIKAGIQKSLSLTKDTLDKIEQEKMLLDKDIQVIEAEKEKIEEDWKSEVKKVREKSLEDFISEADQKFNITQQIEQAVQQNHSAKAVEKYIKQHFPDEVWAKPEVIKKELSSVYVFCLEFFRRDRIRWNIFFVGALVFLYWLGEYFIADISAVIRLYVFNLSPKALLFISSAGAFLTRAIGSYRHLKPLFSKLWSIGQQYKNKIDDAHFMYEQQQRSLAQELSLKQEKIRSLDEQLVANQQIRIKLEHQIYHSLNTIALSDFVSRKSGLDGYRKHQGIIATIREDFEILTDLFSGTLKENDAADGLAELSSPLERIVLYIDDLDRCGEERIVEVLEAVNLLMAFKLFVVVAGIDPHWVKNALVRKRIAGSENKSEAENFETASLYLEKIFQVPFSLKNPQTTFVQNMIRELCNVGETPEVQTETVKTAEMSPESYREELKTNFAIEDSDLANIDHSENKTIVLNERWQTLVFEEEETEQLTQFAILLQPNPRSIKRFVNIYQIISAHQGLVYLEGYDYEQQKLSVMLLLAMQLGKYKSLNDSFRSFVITQPEKTVLDFFELGNVDAAVKQTINELKRLLHQDTLKSSLSLSAKLLAHHGEFVGRFSFGHVNLDLLSLDKAGDVTT